MAPILAAAPLHVRTWRVWRRGARAAVACPALADGSYLVGHDTHPTPGGILSPWRRSPSHAAPPGAVTPAPADSAPEPKGQRQAQDPAEIAARVLAVVGGYVDGVGYVALYRLFTAHESGNSAGLGVALAEADWTDVWRRGLSIVGFVVGVALGTLIVELGRRADIPSTGALVGAAEIAALGAAMGVGELAAHAGKILPADTPPYAVAAACLAAGMGLQTVALRRVGQRTVRTTFVTGVLTNMAETFVAAWFRPDRTARRRALAFAGLLGSIWVLYLGGAVAGAAAELAWSFAALAIPVAVVAGVTAWQWRARHDPSVADQGLFE